jgi:hypothetical protein
MSMGTIAENFFEDEWDDEEGDGDEPHTQCNRCGSRDVRWRQQGGRWVLFSLEPGKLHVCPLKDDAFTPVAE